MEVTSHPLLQQHDSVNLKDVKDELTNLDCVYIKGKSQIAVWEH